MTELHVICENNEIRLSDDNQTYTTKDQEKAIHAVRNWIYGGILDT